MRLSATRNVLEVAEANKDVIIGIKVRVGLAASGPSGVTPLDIALRVVDEIGLPMMVHIDEPPPAHEAVVERLKPSEVLTHCYRPFPNSPVDGKGRVRPNMVVARHRGVIFDIGHGKRGLFPGRRRAMMASDFPPDVISSDLHQLCINGPAHDQVTAMSKILDRGMSLNVVVARSTLAPTRALERPKLGKPALAGPRRVGASTPLLCRHCWWCFSSSAYR
jgi:dihydroorotase